MTFLLDKYFHKAAEAIVTALGHLIVDGRDTDLPDIANAPRFELAQRVVSFCAQNEA